MNISTDILNFYEVFYILKILTISLMTYLPHLQSLMPGNCLLNFLLLCLILFNSFLKDILQCHLLSYVQENLNKNWVFRQDNDLKHICMILKTWMSTKKFMQWSGPQNHPISTQLKNFWIKLILKIHCMFSKIAGGMVQIYSWQY